MRLWKRHSNKALAPEGVRIERTDGTVIECTVTRDSKNDRDGFAQWVAFPANGYIPVEGDEVIIHKFPGKTRIRMKGGPAAGMVFEVKVNAGTTP